MNREFNQPLFDFNKIKLSSIEGDAFKFTIILPIYFKGKRVFTVEDKIRLYRMLGNDLGGCSASNDIQYPPIKGIWEDENGNIIENTNATLMVYTLQTPESKAYFKTLQKNLEKHSGETKILIEIICVQLL